MSMPSVLQVFESGFKAAPGTTSIDSLIRSQLDHAVSKVALNPKATAGATSDLPKTVVTDIGDYLTHVARVLCSFTDLMVTGPHVEMAVTDAHEQSRRLNNVSDLSPIVKLDVEIQKLRKIRELAERFSREVQDMWQPAPLTLPPDASHNFYEIRRTPLLYPSEPLKVDDRVQNNRMMLPNPQMSPSSPPSPDDNMSMTDDSEDEDELFDRIDMDALKQRGKGSYYCPLGHRCDKGGVNREGDLVLFDRNSSFAQHCNKHRKPWRCDIPGCPNPPKKRKFARRDGLDRHKATVKHRIIIL
ncbi:hypothetical protein QQZ08_012247 [Neonectria magnoliae]|uniref:C2H2-type domain-containing protein n=1 Tax=Neonectria magnoliae TaxID=2732573 RepID=A0ABR1H3Z0_9HYPO